MKSPSAILLGIMLLVLTGQCNANTVACTTAPSLLGGYLPLLGSTGGCSIGTTNLTGTLNTFTVPDPTTTPTTSTTTPLPVTVPPDPTPVPIPQTPTVPPPPTTPTTTSTLPTVNYGSSLLGGFGLIGGGGLIGMSYTSMFGVQVGSPIPPPPTTTVVPVVSPGVSLLADPSLGNPEPSTLILVGVGIAGLAWWRRRR